MIIPQDDLEVCMADLIYSAKKLGYTKDEFLYYFNLPSEKWFIGKEYYFIKNDDHFIHMHDIVLSVLLYWFNIKTKEDLLNYQYVVILE